MTEQGPSRKHVEAMAEVIDTWPVGRRARLGARVVLTSTDPDVLDAMQDALVRAGRLREFKESWPTPKRCFVTEWQEEQ